MSHELTVAEILESKVIRDLVKTHSLTKDEINIYECELVSYYLDQCQCGNCREKCPKNHQERVFYVERDEYYLVFGYRPCEKYLRALEDSRANENFQVVLGTAPAIDNLIISQERAVVLNKIKAILDKQSTKGLYLHGSFGSGKTVLATYLGRKLAASGDKVAFVYFPEFVWQVKNWMVSGKLQEVVNYLKDADCLILDDFGGATLSDYVRDEVILPILQHRATNNIMTIFTSNLDKQALREYLMTGKNQAIDTIRGDRMYERIRMLADFVELVGKNYRN